ncbi:NHL repeat-containing protein 2 isoform X1 [Hylaeus volcanicus]|uniref:NHL repeat-containing protein 2 isoform X1 n=2 Tax=Hylaeus volcanicus TaxID=313075 RepID=UPI0023B86B2A|nr:NHL repeat-containing protein 2 isoform X1 [Hylaeus volcanicus]
MTVRDTIRELTQVCMEIRSSLESLDRKEQEKLILRHIKTFAGKGLRIADFKTGLEWFNVTEGLSVYQHLAGKIIFLDFFTYCCINCMHILPDLDALEKQFSIADGLVVIGVHSAKFSNERDSKRLLSAVQRYNITHPVVNDSTLSTWRNLGISCWPSVVMIGPMGEPLAVFVGEGHKKEMLLYTNVALAYFKSLNQISKKNLPLQLARHLLPTGGKENLLFPSKLEVFQSGQRESLIIADTGNNRILVTDVTGNVEHIIGGSQSGFRDGDFENATFNAPQGVCALGSSIYVADNENHAIRKIDLTKRTVTTVAGTGSQGHDYVGGKPGKDQALSSPWDVAIYNYEHDKHIVPVLLIAIAGTHQIWALFLEDTTWWKDRKYKAGTCAAIVGSGREENRNNSYPHTAGLAQPSGLVVVQEKKVAFFADSESSTVRRIDLNNGRVSAVCGANKNPSDLHDYGDTDGAQYDAKLQHPLGVTWHANEGVVYVVDTYNHKIKRIDPIGGHCKTIYGGGKPNEKFSFDEPSGIAVSSNGDLLYVADTNNHAVKVIDVKNEDITTLSIKIPIIELDDSSENVYHFDTTISEKGGELNITFVVTFQDSDLKLNPDAPQTWTVKLPSASEWTVKAKSGKLSSPVSMNVTEGSGMHEVHVNLDIIACKTTECIPKKVSVVYRVRQKTNASDVITEQTKLVIK